MASAPTVGRVTIDVKPDIEGFTAGMQSALFALGARDVLKDFAEWLDAEGKLRPRYLGGDDRKPADLVRDFIDLKVAEMRGVEEHQQPHVHVAITDPSREFLPGD